MIRSNCAKKQIKNATTTSSFFRLVVVAFYLNQMVFFQQIANVGMFGFLNEAFQ